MTPVSRATSVQNFVVIGNPIAHSKSPTIHKQFAKQVNLNINYNRQYCPDDAASFSAVVDAFFNGGGVGANVTVPFKEEAFKFCQSRGGLSPHAKVAGAVNTLLLNDQGIYGDNTDGRGLVNDLKKIGWSLSDSKIAIIGAGGATRGIILPLIEAGASHITIANRTLSKAESLSENLCALSDSISSASVSTSTIDALTGTFDLIINATSVGLTKSKLPLQQNLNCACAYDLMYGCKLDFLDHFESKGAKVSDGYGMLIEQAALSFEQWTHTTIDTSNIK